MENTEKVSFKTCLSEGISLYFKNITTIIIIDLLSLIPLWLQMYLYSSNSAGKSYFIILPFIVFAAMLINHGALYTLFHARYKGEEISLIGALGAGVRVSGRVFLTGLIYGLAVMSGMLLLIIPGIILLFKYWFSIIAAVVEDEDTGPMKLSAAMTKGNAGIIFLTMLVLVVLMIPQYFIYRFPAGNIALSLIIFLLANIFTTIFQTVQYVTYARIRANKAGEIKPEDVKKAGTGAGCGVIAGLTALVFASIVAVSIFVVQGPGMNKIARMIFGSTLTLSENVKFEMPEKWWFFGPVPPGYKGYMAFASGKKGGILGVIIRSAPLTEKDAVALKNTGSKNTLRLINELEGRMYPGRENSTMTAKWNLDKPVKLPKPAKKGMKWHLAIVEEIESPDIKWNVMFLKDGNDLVYLFYRTPYDKSDAVAYAEDEKTLHEMLGGK